MTCVTLFFAFVCISTIGATNETNYNFVLIRAALTTSIQSKGEHIQVFIILNTNDARMDDGFISCRNIFDSASNLLLGSCVCGFDSSIDDSTIITELTSDAFNCWYNKYINHVTRCTNIEWYCRYYTNNCVKHVLSIIKLSKQQSHEKKKTKKTTAIIKKETKLNWVVIVVSPQTTFFLVLFFSCLISW